MNTDRSPRFKFVDFDLPFLVFVRDSLRDPQLEAWVAAYNKGASPLPYARYAPHEKALAGLMIGGGLPVYIPPKDLADYYLTAVRNIQVGIKFLRRVNPFRPTKLIGEVPGDRAGKASFSTVRVMFDLTDFEKTSHWDARIFVEFSIEAINHFISHYRVIANRPYIYHVTPSVVQEFRVTTVFEDDTQQVMEYGAASGPLHGMGGAIADEADQALRERVCRHEPPAVEEVLDVNIRDHLDSQNWRLAVVESAVLFEAWLTQFLTRILARQGLEDHNIHLKFRDKRGRVYGVTYLASKLVFKVTRFDFKNTVEYQNWGMYVRDVRNEIVHGERLLVGREEAERAYSATCAAISRLKNV